MLLGAVPTRAMYFLLTGTYFLAQKYSWIPRICIHWVGSIQKHYHYRWAHGWSWSRLATDMTLDFLNNKIHWLLGDVANLVCWCFARKCFFWRWFDYSYARVHLSSVVQGVLLWAQLVGDNMVMRLESWLYWLYKLILVRWGAWK